MQKQIIDKKVKFYVIDAISLGQKLGLGPRINMIMQAAFFEISGILPTEQAVAAIKKAIKKTYGNKGEAVVEMNNKAVDAALENIHEVKYPRPGHEQVRHAACGPRRCSGVRQGSHRRDHGRPGRLAACQQDAGRRQIPAGYHEVREAQHRGGNTGVGSELCIQCGRCSLFCPHATIRMKAYDESALAGAPADVQVDRGQGQDSRARSTLFRCARGLHRMRPVRPELPGAGEGREQAADRPRARSTWRHRSRSRESERENWEFFLSLPETDTSLFSRDIGAGQPVPAGHCSSSRAHARAAARRLT